jgi:hypothetical protein
LQDSIQAAYVGLLGFGWDWVPESIGSDEFVVAVPTPVPATAGVRFRSVATGTWHSLALTEEGEVCVWTAEGAGGPKVPTIIEELRGHRVRRRLPGPSKASLSPITASSSLGATLKQPVLWGPLLRHLGTLSRLTSSAVARGAWRR